MATSSKTEKRFQSFMQGFYATVALLQRAEKSGCFIECVCLSISLLDGLLRIGLTLKHQLKTNSTDLLDELLCQSDQTRIVSERQIYKKALHESIIDQSCYEKLNDLYEKRNQVVHRYIISEITTSQVLDIAIACRELIDDVNQAVRKVEDEQIRRGVGMTRAGTDVKDSTRVNVEKYFQDLVNAKHGNQNLSDNLRRR